MRTVNYPLALVATCIWIGFVCAISFMEAWLKFRAPGINLPLGLGIGRLVFNALNKVEWVLALSIIMNVCFRKRPVMERFHVSFAVAFLILLIQTVYALPELDLRAELHIQNLEVPPSNLHFYYIIMEFVKVICLFIFGIHLFKKSASCNL